jgi:Xaa-Pro dipeptidase
MTLAFHRLSHPLSSGEIDLTNPERFDDVEHKQRRIAEFLERHQYDAVLLQDVAGFAWFTSGAECPRLPGEAPAAALFITPDARVVVANNIDAGYLFDRELGGLGFQLKQRPWHEDRRILLEDLCRGRKVASDSGIEFTTLEAESLAALRRQLTPVERERMRTLAGLVTHAVEATARSLSAGQTEVEIAGELAHRLVKHAVHPLRTRVIADGRAAVYRHWIASETPLKRWCLVGAIGSRWGLHCACMRAVVLESPAPEVIASYHQAAMLAATAMFFSQSGSPLATVWQKVRRIYEKLGFPDEWQLADQADVIGYRPREVPLVPQTEFELQAGMAIHWYPSLGPVQMGDTVLVGDAPGELMTRPVEWPQLCVTVKGEPVYLPDLLIREAAGPSTGTT